MIVHPLAVDLDVATASFYDADGFLGIGIAGVAAKVALVTPEAHHPLGILARPLDPETDGAGNPGRGCTVLRLSEGGSDHVVALGDPRVTPLVPLLEKGGICLYEPTNDATDLARVMLNDDGSHRILVHAAQGKKITIEVADGPTITFDGGATPPSVTVTVGGTSLVVDDTNGVQAGAPGGIFAALATPALLTWLAAVGTATGAGAPPPFAATKLKAT